MSRYSFINLICNIKLIFCYILLMEVDLYFIAISTWKKMIHTNLKKNYLEAKRLNVS